MDRTSEETDSYTVKRFVFWTNGTVPLEETALSKRRWTPLHWTHWRKIVRDAVMTFLVLVSFVYFPFVFLGSLMQSTTYRMWEKRNCYGPSASKLFFPNDKNLLGWLVAPAESEAAGRKQAQRRSLGNCWFYKCPQVIFVIMEVWETLFKTFVHLILTAILEGRWGTKVELFSSEPRYTAVKLQGTDLHSGSLTWTLRSFLPSMRFWKKYMEVVGNLNMGFIRCAFFVCLFV